MNIRNYSIVWWVLIIMLIAGVNPVYAESQLLAQAVQGDVVTELQKNIEAKNAELQQIQQQRESLAKTLEEVSKSGASIKKDIQLYNTNINQLNLSIKSSTINIEKLGLEINSLAEEIENITASIASQKETIGNLFTEMQRRDRDTLFSRIMRSETLSDSIAEMQSIATLNAALITNIGKLKELQDDYASKINETKQKKSTKEVQINNLVNIQQITLEQKSEKQKLLEQTKSVEQIYEQQIEELDKKQGEISAIIEETENALRQSFDPTLLPSKNFGVLKFPAEELYITQCYGPTPFAYRAYRTKTHNGVDFGIPVGTPILAVDSGKVVKVGNNDRGTSRWNKYQYGKYVVIQHGNNLATLYAHLSKFNVKEGDTVTEGQVIAYSGNTGYSSGAHLHLTVFWAPSVQYKPVPPAAGLVPIGVTIDPTSYLPSLTGIPKSKDAGCKK